MLFERKLFERAVCSRKEKVEALELFDIFRQLSEQARMQGLLSLESVKLSDPLLQSGIRSIVDALDPKIVREKLLTKVMADGLAGIALLRAMIIIDGVLMIQMGTNLMDLHDKLICYLGVDSDLAGQWKEQDSSSPSVRTAAAR